LPLPKNIKSILFIVPTICHVAPETIPNGSHQSANAIHLHEDDWRQIEFIAATDLPLVEHEMAEIEAFKRSNWTGVGFTSVRIRKERPDGLCPSRLPFSLIDSIPHGPIQVLTIGTIGAPKREEVVKGGFAVRLSASVFLYGRQSEGIIIDLGLSRGPDEKEADEMGSLLVLCKKFNLGIADWCASRVVARP